MIKQLLGLFTGGLGATAQGVARGVATFTGDKVQRESNVHDEQMAVLDQVGAEFLPRENRTWWDSLVDGLNRLIRPAAALTILYEVFIWPAVDPVGFAATMQAYALVPEWLALLAAQVLLLFFGGRMLDKWPRKLKGPSAAEVNAVLETQRKIRDLANDNAPAMEDEAFQAAMADTSKPLSNAAIMEWNRRRRARK